MVARLRDTRARRLRRWSQSFRTKRELHSRRFVSARFCWLATLLIHMGRTMPCAVNGFVYLEPIDLQSAAASHKVAASVLRPPRRSRRSRNARCRLWKLWHAQVSRSLVSLMPCVPFSSRSSTPTVEADIIDPRNLSIAFEICVVR